MTDVVDLRGVGRTFGRVVALREVTLAVPGGQFVAVMGATGSGKSTLLHCAAGLDRPTSGRVRLAGHDVTRMREARLTKLRRDRVGFVFQAYNLLSELTVRQNVALPGRLGGPRTRKVDDVLATVGLGGMGRRPVGELSGGQRQRVAIARALVTAPAVIFADEPTGALDPTTGGQVLALLRQAVDRDAVTVVMVTHDPAAAAWSDRMVLLREGRVSDDTPTPEAAEIAARLRAVTPVPAGSGHDAGAAALAGRPGGGPGPGGASGAEHRPGRGLIHAPHSTHRSDDGPGPRHAFGAVVA
jgi:putative ABC transport system ATP-binding protein